MPCLPFRTISLICFPYHPIFKYRRQAITQLCEFRSICQLADKIIVDLVLDSLLIRNPLDLVLILTIVVRIVPGVRVGLPFRSLEQYLCVGISQIWPKNTALDITLVHLSDERGDLPIATRCIQLLLCTCNASGSFDPGIIITY